ncbi:MAG TPA: hypothetical protein DCY80_04925 [Solibacterales bacterium]|nr:hypothetical protein [Bryobacterales bacterium]
MPLTEQEMLYCMVLDSVANDYESLETILEEVKEWANDEYIQVTTRLIIELLAQLLRGGEVVAYRLTTTSTPQVLASVNLDELHDDAYFFITPEGRKTAARLAGLWPRRSEGGPKGSV